MKWMESNGMIELKRQAITYAASFGIISGDLPVLMDSLYLLHETERAYFNLLKTDMRRTSYLLGRLAAKTAIAQLMGNNVMDRALFYIDFGVFNFPVVKSLPLPGMQVSISHCGHTGMALAFPEEHPLGIDIEKTDPEKMAVLEGFITAKDRQQLQGYGLTGITGYTLLWTVKESLSKVIRTGLTMDPGIMEVKSLEKTGILYTSTFSHWPQYKSISFFCGEYVCSITLARHTTPDLDQFVQCCLHTCIPS